jgi:hypothetical protein
VVSTVKVSAVMARVPATAMVVVALAIATSCWTASAAVAAGDANVAVPCANENLSGFEAYLPDCRALELVTPAYKDGYAVPARAISEDGSRVLGSSLGDFAGAVGGPQTRGTVGLYYELARGSNGWQANPLTPANPQFREATTFYTATGDLTRTLFSMPTAPVGEDNFYVRGPGASLVDVGPITPPADGPTQVPGPESAISVSDFAIAGASSDLSHIVFSLDGRAGWNGDLTLTGRSDLYEYVGTGKSEPVMVAVTGGPGSRELIGQCGAALGGPRFTSLFNAVSENGDTVFFTPVAKDGDPACAGADPAVAELYARVSQSETVAVSAAECHSGCAAGPLSDSVFAGASHDGSKVLFVSTQKLTEQASEDSTAGDTADHGVGSGCQEARGTGCNLYEYDFSKPIGERLIAVSAGSATPHVQGVVRISEDGSHVYFVAQGKLTNEANARGEEVHAGMNNLYVFEPGVSAAEGRVRFVTALAPSEERNGRLISSDEVLWGRAFDIDVRPAQTTPEGAHLAFESHADLTSDDTSKGVWQVFEYDAPTGTLRRVSVGNGGFNNNGNTNEYNATIPTPSLTAEPGVPFPTRLALSNDGKYVFFESADDLTAGMGSPGSGTGTSNVYEYHEGGVYLIYGANGARVTFLGTSTTGSDAFFQTEDKLVPEDTDTQADVYDERIQGGRPLQTVPEKCQAESCLGGLAGVSVLGVPGSATLTGDDNLTPSPTTTPAPKATTKKALAKCGKGKKRSHGRCAKAKIRKKINIRHTSSHRGGK